MFCIKCGNALSDDDLFCSECGTKIDRKSDVPQSTRQQFTDPQYGVPVPVAPKKPFPLKYILIPTGILTAAAVLIVGLVITQVLPNYVPGGNNYVEKDSPKSTSSSINKNTSSNSSGSVGGNSSSTDKSTSSSTGGNKQPTVSKEQYTSPKTGKVFTVPDKGFASITYDGEEKTVPAEHKDHTVSEYAPYDNQFYAYLDGSGETYSTNVYLYFALIENGSPLKKCEDCIGLGLCGTCYSGRCIECSGSGQVWNPIIGTITCSDCGGSGKCAYCNDGKCKSCGGSGKLSAGSSKGAWKSGTSYALSELKNDSNFISVNGIYREWGTSSALSRLSPAIYSDAEFKIIDINSSTGAVKWYFSVKISKDGSSHTFEGVANTVRGEKPGKIGGSSGDNPGGSLGNNPSGSSGNNPGGTINICFACGGTGKCNICHGSNICQSCFGKGGQSYNTWGQGGSGWVTCSGCNGNKQCKYCDSGKCGSCGGSGHR